jgi:phosphatidylserine decarboxylase
LASLLLLVVNFFCGFLWSLPFWASTVFILQFFRDPAARCPTIRRRCCRPRTARRDGRQGHDPYLEREALKISVFMNVFNVHSNRSPVDGTVKQRWYHAGSFLNAALDKASLENERNALWLQTAAGRTSPACRSRADRAPDPLLC